MFLFICWHHLHVAPEFWVSTDASSRNLGTKSNPFICTNEAKFDFTMSQMPANCTIHIKAGVYFTKGSVAGFLVKTGQQIIGSGIDTTVLKLSPGSPDWTSVIGSSFGTNMLVENLTCDANYQAQNKAPVTYCGATLFGTHNAIKRVKVINLAKFGGNSEAWGVVLNENNVGESDGNLIEGCEVSDFQGGSAISAFSLNGSDKNPISGIVRNNRVLLKPTQYPTVAFNENGIHDTIYESNYVNGATVGFYGDTGGSTNVLVDFNTFDDVLEGISLQNAGRQNMTFSHNTIKLASDISALRVAVILQNAWIANITINWNFISWTGKPPEASIGYFLIVNHVKNLAVTHNVVDSSLVNEFGADGINTFVIQNNYDTKGNPYSIYIVPHVINRLLQPFDNR
jgi:hypothetical protein